MAQKGLLALESGEVFYGDAFGAAATRTARLGFTTHCVGYQELLTDPALDKLAMVMAYPVTGCCGVTYDDDQSGALGVSAVITRDYCDHPSNFRCVKTLSEQLEERGIPAISGPDTRELVRLIRARGQLRCCVSTEDIEPDIAVRLARDAADSAGDFARRKPRRFRTDKPRFELAALDLGVKRSVIMKLCGLGCNVSLLRADADVNAILEQQPDGLLITSGPGDPAAAGAVEETLRQLSGRLPTLGLGKGFLVLARALGADTEPLKYGRYGDMAVRVRGAERIITASAAYEYALKGDTLAATPLEPTMLDLSGRTVAAKCEKLGLLGALFSPEGGPGPEDEAGIYSSFVAMMEEGRRNA